jgi:hypothetical protein
MSVNIYKSYSKSEIIQGHVFLYFSKLFWHVYTVFLSYFPGVCKKQKITFHRSD